MQARPAYFHDSCAHVIFPVFDCGVYRTPTLELISFICKCSLHNQYKHGIIQEYPITCTTLHVNLAFAYESIFGNFCLQSVHFQGKVKVKVKSCPITGLNRHTGFQEVKAPDFLTSAHEGGRLSALGTGRLYPQN
jgi:hypothetical protein